MTLKTGGIIILAAAVFTGVSARASLSPEQETLEISKHLKPIPDDQWANIAGTKTTETYEIVQGDTLYDISKRLFGDARYWPKIWALNNLGKSSITNPHLIRPGNRIAFQPGSGNSLPSVGIEAENGNENSDTLNDAESPVQVRTGKSEEWKNLPRQPWETVQIQLPPDVDADGFDKHSKLTFGVKNALQIPAVAASEKISPLGRITGSRSNGTYLEPRDTVFIQSDEGLQVGEFYGITTDPTPLIIAPAKKPMGYSYRNLGRVQIESIRDNVYVGTLLDGMNIITRNMYIVPLLPKVEVPTPIPGPEPLGGTLYVDRELLSTETIAQNKVCFVDRGGDDGIKEGMVFRAYIHQDPVTNKEISENDFIRNADFLVLQVSAKVSALLVINSDNAIDEGQELTLLTDVSDVLKKDNNTSDSSSSAPPPPSTAPTEPGASSQSPSESPPPPPAPAANGEDDLDKLDNNQGLGKDEKRELKQLEKWKQNPEATPTPGASESSDVPPPPPGKATATPEAAAPSPAPALEPSTAPTVPPAPESPAETNPAAPAPPPESPAVTPPASTEAAPLPPVRSAPAEGGGDEIPPPPPAP